MNTDDLIDFLSTRVEAVDPARQDRLVARAALGALVLAMLLVLLLLGPRTDMPGALATPAFLMKAMFLLAVVATGLRGLLRAARAGEEKRHALRLVLLPLALVWIAAAAQLAGMPRGAWGQVILFHEWRLCVVAIPLLSLLPLALITIALREAVPTELPYCGALLGLVSGGIGALGYAAYCMNDTPAYLGVWYAAGIGIATFAGWLAGPRLLRW
ncbi:DUF1109 domain-containing protein [Xanthobacter sp. V3C-3]|uniref:NrsF family protein n=1 Tax=Xanthobacter lutulentifluminis TaxID=3119935 RepID=UPI0037270F6F